MQKSIFLETALMAAQEAEKIVMDYYAKGCESKQKADRSYVTAADQEAEKKIIEIIKSTFPEHGFFGEESGQENMEAQYYWAIDPIDGTNNFVHRLPFWGIEIALVKEGDIILGVSNAPAMKELMYAENGMGAYLNNEKVSVSVTSELEQAFMSFGGPKYFDKKNIINNLVKLTTDVNNARGFGDFWSYHLVAQGKMDLMIEAKTNLYDIAAVKVIVEEAGGKVTDFKGNPIGINSQSIAASNGKFHAEILKYFS